MATSTIPADIPTTTEISLITGKTEIYDASGTLTSFEYSYYSVPFLVWIFFSVLILFVFYRLIIEVIKR